MHTLQPHDQFEGRLKLGDGCSTLARGLNRVATRRALAGPDIDVWSGNPNPVDRDHQCRERQVSAQRRRNVGRLRLRDRVKYALTKKQCLEAASSDSVRKAQD